jgi:LAS superfamily LD-carboxypeptidase LdcB
MKKIFLTVLFLFSAIIPAHAELNIQRLSDEDIQKVKTLIEHLTPLIQDRQKQENISTLTFEELYTPLTKEEQAFLKSFQALDAKKLGVKIPFRGIATGHESLVMIKDQKVIMNGKETVLAPQFLPKDVYENYLHMIDAMEKDIGKRLYVESGYRSSAYQLYLFVYYLQNHDYSIRETVKWVALPGYSEHGSPEHQAIDFISVNGISGETDPAQFEALEEYKWLLQNASKFNFTESYPKNAPAGITYEPWHWRWEPTP